MFEKCQTRGMLKPGELVECFLPGTPLACILEIREDGRYVVELFDGAEGVCDRRSLGAAIRPSDHDRIIFLIAKNLKPIEVMRLYGAFAKAALRRRRRRKNAVAA